MIRSPKAFLLTLTVALVVATIPSLPLHAQSTAPSNRERLQELEAARMVQRQARAQAHMEQSPTLFDLDFRGGTIGDYAEAIRAANPDANIVLLGDVARQPVPAIRLRSVDVHAALGVIQHEIKSADEYVRIHVNPVRATGSREGVYQIIREHQTRTKDAPPRAVSSMVWSLAEIVDSGTDAESVLGAVQTGIELADFGDDTIRIRYHEPTRLLIAIGTPQQLDLIQQVISALELQIEV